MVSGVVGLGFMLVRGAVKTSQEGEVRRGLMLVVVVVVVAAVDMAVVVVGGGRKEVKGLWIRNQRWRVRVGEVGVMGL